MSKWAEVTLLTSTTYAVEIEDNETLEDAEKHAVEDFGSDGITDVHESHLAKDEANAESISRHADKRLDL